MRVCKCNSLGLSHVQLGKNASRKFFSLQNNDFKKKPEISDEMKEVFDEMEREQTKQMEEIETKKKFVALEATTVAAPTEPPAKRSSFSMFDDMLSSSFEAAGGLLSVGASTASNVVSVAAGGVRQTLGMAGTVATQVLPKGNVPIPEAVKRGGEMLGHTTQQAASLVDGGFNVVAEGGKVSTYAMCCSANARRWWAAAWQQR